MLQRLISGLGQVGGKTGRGLHVSPLPGKLADQVGVALWLHLALSENVGKTWQNPQNPVVWNIISQKWIFCSIPQYSSVLDKPKEGILLL